MKKAVDCIFLFSPGIESEGSCFTYHLGSAYILSYLKSKHINAIQFINSDPVSLNGCVKKILDYNPRIVGFTVYNSNFNISALIASQIKKNSPKTILVFGGPCPSVHYDFIMSCYPFVDACFINESEETFLQFIFTLSKNNFEYSSTDFTGIRGISYRVADRVFCNPENRILRDNSGTQDYLDKYPSPYLCGVIPATEGHNIGILTARGCNQNCVYCNCTILSNRRFTTHSIDRVIEELKFVSKNWQRNHILTFQDDAFTLIPQRARKICSAIIDNKIKVRLGCITRCDHIDESLLDLMKEAGFVSIAFSLESANPETLRRIGKVHVAEDIPTHSLEKEIKFIESLERVTAYAKTIGIEYINASIMTGLPGETISEAKRTIEAIDRNKNIDHYAHNFLTLFKGTPLYSNYKRYGYKIRNFNDNPIFPKVTYPCDVIREVPVSTKSNLHSLKELNDKSTINTLSLTYKQNKVEACVNNIILQSDNVEGKFVSWLKDILTINGTIIQIYSDPKSMMNLVDRNYEVLIKYLSPSLKILNYCYEKTYDGLFLTSSTSIVLKTDKSRDKIRVCDSEFVKSNLANQSVNFNRTLCKEDDSRDSVSTYSYLKRISKKKDPFSYLINLSALPYFANICKWTKELSNCTSRNTLIVNNKSEIRLCWVGAVIGEVGQSYDELLGNLKSEQDEIMSRRQCSICLVKDSCIKCLCPSPMSEKDYCKNRKSGDVSVVAELMIGLDQIKQLFL